MRNQFIPKESKDKPDILLQHKSIQHESNPIWAQWEIKDKRELVNSPHISETEKSLFSYISFGRTQLCILHNTTN